MKLRQPDLFPTKLVDFLSKVSKDSLRDVLIACISSSITSTTNLFDYEYVNLDMVKILDKKALDLLEKGRNDYMKSYRLARLASAAVTIKLNFVELALYDYTIYYGKENINELIAHLQKKLNKTQHNPRST